MSMHNLLELDALEVSNQGSPGRPRPKPRPRITATAMPHPKPKRRVERDVDEVMSMSSVSSEDHRSQAAFDNPVFQVDDNEDDKSNRTTKNRVLSSESESEINQRETGKIKTKASKGKSRRAYVEDMKDKSSSGWDEEETFLTIENEMDDKSIPMPRSKHTKIMSPSIKSRRSTSTPIEEFIIQASPNVQDKIPKESHVAIDIEKIQDDDKNDEEKPSDKQKSSKPRLVDRWKTFLRSSSGQSQSNSLEKVEKQSVKHRKSKLAEDETTPSNKPKKAAEKTLIEMPSEDSSSDDESAKKTGRDEMKAEKIDAIKADELKSSKTSVQSTKTEKMKLRFKIRGKSVPKEQLVNSSHQLEEIENEQQSPEIKSSRRKRSPQTYNINAPGKDLLFGITIHASDLLPLDPNIMHPVVKVTLMNQEGKLLHKTSGFLTSNGSKTDGDPSHREDDSESKRRRKKGRTSSEKNPSPSDSIFPIMTQPFKMSQINPTFAPAWNELLLFEEPFERFIEDNAGVIVFFEVMDFLPMGRTAQIPTSGYHGMGSDAGWYKVAWAFLKPVGANGVFNVERKLRLQLFKPVKLRNKDVLQGPEVFSWWKSGKRDKLQNTTLYVTVKGVNPPRNTKANLRQLLSMRKEDLTEAIIEGQLAAKKPSKTSKKGKNLDTTMEAVDKRKQIQWARLEGQSCKVPNKLVASLPTSQIQSLNINVSGNVYCLKFSPCGLKLAAGLDTDELHAVLVFEIPSGNLLRCMKNHHGLIYDLTWKQMDIDDNSYVTYLASASADSTAIVWRMKNNDESTLGMVKTLHHPSYVYCVKFHPTHPSILVTGCFDYIVRIWDITTKGNTSGQGKTTLQPDSNFHDSCPLFILDRHYSFVNALLFDNAGLFLFSGDGNSCLYKWSIKSPTKRKTWKIHKDVKLTETGDIPINSLSLHPNGNRLLVHLRDNCLKILDVDTLIQIQTFSGLINDKLQIRSCFSPCGNLVLSGSENPTICIWDADTSTIVKFMSPKNHPNCFVAAIDYHPFDFYLAVGLASPICEPSPVLLYHYDIQKLSNIAVVQSSIAKFKSNLRKKQNLTEQDYDGNSTRKNVTFASVRADSSEKFLNIINKLDKALKDARDPTKYRFTEQGLSRSLSLDTEIFPSKPPKPSSVHSTERPQRHKVESSSENDIENAADSYSVSRKKSKSPRTYIENRLEELILSKRTTTEKSEIQNPNEEVIATKELEDAMLLSPKNLPKPRKRPQSSKIPIRCQPDSPQENIEDVSSTVTPKYSPIKKGIKEAIEIISQQEHQVSVEVYSHTTENEKQKEPQKPQEGDQISALHGHNTPLSPTPPRAHPRKYSKR